MHDLPVTADRSMSRRNYGPREDEPCGSWRPLKRRYPETSQRRAVCRRPYHRGDSLHYTAGRTHWWIDGDRDLYIATDTPLPQNVVPVRDSNLRTTDNPTTRGNDLTSKDTAMTCPPEPSTAPEYPPPTSQGDSAVITDMIDVMLRIAAWGLDDSKRPDLRAYALACRRHFDTPGPGR